MDSRELAKTAGSFGTGLALTAVGLAFALPAVAGGAVLMYAAAGYFWWQARKRESRAPKAPRTLREHFERFSPLLNIAHTKHLTRDGEEIAVRFQFHFDWVAKSDFVSVYLPSNRQPASIAAFLSGIILDGRREVQGSVATSVLAPGDRELSSHKSTFSGRVYLYHEDPFEIAELAELSRGYADRGMDVQFRGPEYAAVHKLDVPRRAFPPRTD